MKAVFLLQWRRFYRKPLLVLAMFGLTVIFVSVTAAGGQSGPQMVPVYAEESMNGRQAQTWLERLNDGDQFQFELMTEPEARSYVAEGDVSQAVNLLETDYRLLVGREDPARFALDSFLRRIYSEELRLEQAEQTTPGIRADVESSLADPALTLSVESLQGVEDSFQYNGQLQLLFGMTLFFVIYTIMFSLVRIVDEKRTGTWSRMIISPVRKWQMYLGHLGYSFLIGFFQITLIFLLFRFAFGFELGDRFWLLIAIAACYTFSIVALGLLIISLITKPQQLGAVIPIVATGMAMMGGAFWPIELVTNEILLAISKALPITYGLQALTSVAVYGNGLQAVAMPLLLLLGFGSICMAIAIRLMEWRSAS
ncbi:multidrug ABC transporter permease [Planococcus plakortidis]|uniref:Multidrug ABC transporter permease n=1 Tax=Planococcus plakortidis TaxID=1038856 RepID=A0A1C7E8A3_9BACL|nr:ABC transporter permease [Planococcus plakortidis]ANU19921.1 multidrug ABC transporter permease [Planococcus plakortidis]